MINLVGATYQYQGEQLAAPEIIFVQDHHYNEQQHSFPVKQLLENSTCDPKEHVVIFDHVLQHDDVLKDYQLVSFPSFLARENTEFVDQHIVPDWTNKTKTFNFMINKPRPHRVYLLELINEFGLDNYCYSLAWKHNSINDIAVTDYRFGPEVVMDRGVRNGSFLNAHTYQDLLQKTVFEPTCISLITEPAFYERETIVTEKTMMAMYAGTIPIWVGGWKIPDYLRGVGFDLFDDIVDHSYQNLTDPRERCYTAIQLNIDLLNNWSGFTASHLERLSANVQLLESNLFTTICQNKFVQLPKNIQKNLEFLGIKGLTKYK